MNLSLLQNFKENNFFLDPFPHIIIENALPEELYNKLSNTYPTNRFNNTNENNNELVLYDEEIQKDNEISDLWKNFISFHKSKEFCHQIFDIFSKSIVTAYPNFFKNKEELYNLKVALNESDDADIFLSSGIYCNTPVKKKSARVGIHADTPSKITSTLFYMKDKQDIAGGDLILHYWRVNLPIFLKKIILAKRKNFLNNIIKKFQFLFIGNRKKLKYQSNVLIMYLDSIDSLHSVTAREVTKNFRRFCFFRQKYKKRLYESYSIIDRVLYFKNYKFFKF